MKKVVISNLLRRLGLFLFADRIRFCIYYVIKWKINRSFRKANPEVKLPPDNLIYESFQLDYNKFYKGSLETAKRLVSDLGKFIRLNNLRILDWGCGPGRIIRHLPALTEGRCNYYGTDYNKKSIDWCTENLQNIEFNHNSIIAKLPYPDNFFDVVLGISVFTHLSEKSHYDWYSELFRITRSGGIMYFTTQGNNYKVKLTTSELKKFNAGYLIVRGKVKEGHRTYSAFQPENFMERLFCNAEILQHLRLTPDRGGWLPHDIWIVRKSK